MVFIRKSKDSVTMTIEITDKENEILQEMKNKYKFTSKEAVIKYLINGFELV